MARALAARLGKVAAFGFAHADLERIIDHIYIWKIFADDVCFKAIATLFPQLVIYYLFYSCE